MVNFKNKPTCTSEIQIQDTDDSCERNVDIIADSDTCHLGQLHSASSEIQAPLSQSCACGLDRDEIHVN